MKEQLIPITIVIADRSYRIKIQPKDEEVVRKIIKLINEKVVDFKTQFAGKDTQDYIAMVLVWFATDQNTSSANWVEKENISSKLTLLEKMLDTNLPS